MERLRNKKNELWIKVNSVIDSSNRNSNQNEYFCPSICARIYIYIIFFSQKEIIIRVADEQYVGTDGFYVRYQMTTAGKEKPI